MLVGKCTKCNKRYIGWALSRPEHQECPECSTKLIIRNMGANYKPDSTTLAAAMGTGKEEWQESLENTLPHFLL
jgi:DNA-directed RNA polymerase subunit RPC12/RpoP